MDLLLLLCLLAVAAVAAWGLWDEILLWLDRRRHDDPELL